MSTPDQKKKKKISTRTSDGQVFELEEHLAMECDTIKTFFDNFSRDTVMPLPNVKSWEMVKLIEFCTKVRELETQFGVKYMDIASSTEEQEKKEAGRFLEAFRAEFNKDLSHENLVYFLCAVNYLNIEVLMMILCQCMADGIKNKSVEYCRDLFGVQNDYTHEEEAKYRDKYAWVFEGLEIEE
ncbi:hypothetical protein M0R45_014190 [Rubus argutus]|uniref:SKP1-like protein n=1 Tax=Rubus argutus TaxID=59490 RepID=A0AAW1XKN9_RUBAR